MLACCVRGVISGRCSWFGASDTADVSGWPRLVQLELRIYGRFLQVFRCWWGVFQFFSLVWDLKQLILFIFSFILLEIQCLGLSLIGCLITKKNLFLVTGRLLAKILVSSLQRFKDVAELQVKVGALSWTEFDLVQISFRTVGIIPTLH